MNEIEVIKTLFNIQLNNWELADGNTLYSISSETPDDNTIILKITRGDNSNKIEFEEWLKNIDNELFSEILDELEDEGLYNLNEEYKSNSTEVIDKVKNAAKNVINKKIKNLQSLLTD